MAAECGNVKAANVVMVGMLAAAMDLPVAEMELAIKDLVPPGVLDINLAAFSKGYATWEK